jgi:hypothetical protein
MLYKTRGLPLPVISCHTTTVPWFQLKFLFVIVSNLNMDAQHTCIMKKHVYIKLTKEIHDQGKKCVYMTQKKKYIHQVVKQSGKQQTTKLRKLRGTIKCST